MIFKILIKFKEISHVHFWNQIVFKKEKKTLIKRELTIKWQGCVCVCVFFFFFLCVGVGILVV